MDRAPLLKLLDDYAARWPAEMSTVTWFREFAQANNRCFERDCWAGHITGSAWLLNPRGTHVLLTHHRKLGRWLQLGGHSDGHADSLAVARREAEEESGLEVEVLDGRIFDLDVHEIPARGQDPAHYHFDVRYAFRARSEAFAVSAESLELAWVPLAGLETYTSEESVLRMARKPLAALT